MASKVAIATGAGTFDGLAAGPVSGRGVLLLHGFPEDSGQWLGQLPALAAAGFRAVAFDQRGYSSGVRPVEVDAYGPEDLIGDVLAVAVVAVRSRGPRLGIGGGMDDRCRLSRAAAYADGDLDAARRGSRWRAAVR